ncbi:MAG: cation-transporting P-type ATPase, partial [Candidatus Gracilibacteria bacterium]
AFGKIAALTTDTKKDLSPLQKELSHIGVFVGKLTLIISLVLFLIGIFVQGRGIIDTLLFAVAVAVAAVPEGLPATITVALALGVQRMAKKNAIVKQLSSVETLGSTTVICSDKTGTLTKNEMTVQEIIMDKFDVIVRGVGYEPEGSFSIHHNVASNNGTYFEYEKKDLPGLGTKNPVFYKHLELLLRTISICNTARITKDENDSRWQILGDPTEGSLITVAEKAGFSTDHIRHKYKKVLELPFDSARKRMSVVAQEKETNEIVGYTKGAPDSILPLCSHTLEDGKIVILTDQKKKEILKRNEILANRALRTIGVAYKKLTGDVNHKYSEEEVESDMVFLGLTAMMDPPREDVKEAVKLTHKAGIRVFIITGDHGLTAHAVAKELGLVKSYGVNIITGEELNKMSDAKLKEAIARGQETIFARVSPEHKLRVVEALKSNGEVVAVTGDGVNDAPALKRADIGVAMGITGTDVSKEAANMVLTDDSFGTIVSAIAEGRTIYENMKKFIYFIFSANIGELLAIFFTIMLKLPAPLTAVLILIVNTLTDVFPSLALGVEPVERGVLERAPRKPDSKIMESSFVKRYVTVGVFIGLVTTATFVGNLLLKGWHFGQGVEIDSGLYMQSATMAFVVLTFLQMVHSMLCRSHTESIFRMNFFGNMYLIGAILFSTIMTIVIVQVPVISQFLKTTPLSLKEWLILIAISFSILIFEETRKFFTRRKYALRKPSSVTQN